MPRYEDEENEPGPNTNTDINLRDISFKIILALFSAVIVYIVLPYYKQAHEFFVKHVLIFTLSMFTVFSLDDIIFIGEEQRERESYMKHYNWGSNCGVDYYDAKSSYSSEQYPIQSPLDQFEIRNLLSLDAPILLNFHLSLTNIRLYLTISALIALVLNVLATNYNKIICNR